MTKVLQYLFIIMIQMKRSYFKSGCEGWMTIEWLLFWGWMKKWCMKCRRKRWNFDEWTSLVWKGQESWWMQRLKMEDSLMKFLRNSCTPVHSETPATSGHHCTMKEGWFMDRKYLFIVFMSHSNHHGYLWHTNHPHESTYLVVTKWLTYLLT